MVAKKVLVDLDFLNGSKPINVTTPVDPGDAVPKSYVDALSSTSFASDIGDGVLTVIPVAHLLNSLDVIVHVYDTVSLDDVICNVVRVDADNINLEFNVAPTLNEYRVVVKS